MREGFTQKRCPKCGGNVFLDRDLYEWYEQCLQCSRIWYLGSIVEVRDRVSETKLEEPTQVRAPSKSK